MLRARIFGVCALHASSALDLAMFRQWLLKLENLQGLLLKFGIRNYEVATDMLMQHPRPFNAGKLIWTASARVEI